MTKYPSTGLTCLVKLIADLRGPNGCPWDKQQTHESLKRYLIEESYEVIHSIDSNNKGLAEELGDVLLQVLIHSQIASEEGMFTIDDVLEALSKKLIQRHPHVFGEDLIDDAELIDLPDLKSQELHMFEGLLDEKYKSQLDELLDEF